MSDTYRVTSTHAENLADGRMVGPGEEVEVDARDPHNKQLIEDGKLTAVADETPKRSSSKKGGGDATAKSNENEGGDES